MYPKTHRALDHGIVTTDETGGMPCHSFHNLYKYMVSSSAIMILSENKPSLQIIWHNHDIPHVRSSGISIFSFNTV